MSEVKVPGRRPGRLLVTAALAVVATVAAAGSVVLAATPADAAPATVTRTSVLTSAASYARSQGYHIGVAVLDTSTGQLYRSGAATSTFASESVVKTMIATRLLVSGRMTGETARMAYKMVTQSDDGMASALYSRVGGDGLINWIKAHYHLPGLGSPPRRTYWWGNTHITPVGMVRFYAKIKSDPKVGPWLLNAMHHATHYGSDGTYQFFGLGTAAPGSAIKQGWGADYDDWSRSADFNTTGLVDDNRYAVAILARGPISTYGSKIASMLTHTARLLLPGGQFPAAPPSVRTLSVHTGAAGGGTRVVLTGTDFTGATAVLFGGTPGTRLTVVAPRRLHVLAPAHASGSVAVRVVTAAGHSRVTKAARFVYAAGPSVTAIAPATGPTAGGVRVTVTGSGFGNVTAVLFGATAGSGVKVTSPGSLSVVAPAGSPGAVDVRVITRYGSSPATAADQFTYADPAVAATGAPTATESTSG